MAQEIHIESPICPSECSFLIFFLFQFSSDFPNIREDHEERIMMNKVIYL